ncbi:MAG: hypothetical protein KA436_06155 [Oligoflexales bacterium]|nr:hypothetical protein [Oligoflexales bacterium]
MTSSPNKKSKFLLILIAILFGLSFGKVFVRLQTTMLGYEIGRLKNTESTLLKKKSVLTMELAKLTTKHSLEKILSKK